MPVFCCLVMRRRSATLSGRDYLVLAGFIVLCLGGGLIIGLLTGPQPDGWYAALEKPDFNPPSALFAPVWTVLYCLIAICGWLVWLAVGFRDVQAWSAFAAQLVLNFAWSFIFFNCQMLALATGEIILLLLAVVWTIVEFWRVQKIAAILLLPYLAWVSFATVLTTSIWRLN